MEKRKIKSVIVNTIVWAIWIGLTSLIFKSCFRVATQFACFMAAIWIVISLLIIKFIK